MMGNMLKAVITLSLFCVLNGQSPARADLMVFTNADLWASSAGSFVTESFDGLTPAFYPEGEHPLGLIDIEIFYLGVGLSGIGVSDPTGTFQINGTNYLEGEVESGGEIFELIFPSAVTAFGADWKSTTDEETLVLELDTEKVIFEDHLVDPGDGFLGITSSTPFSRIRVSEMSTGFSVIDFEHFGMDDVRFTVIPEPATFGLFGLGGMLLVSITRKPGYRVCRLG